jgi:hypothetical protein
MTCARGHHFPADPLPPTVERGEGDFKERKRRIAIRSYDTTFRFSAHRQSVWSLVHNNLHVVYHILGMTYRNQGTALPFQ